MKKYFLIIQFLILNFLPNLFAQNALLQDYKGLLNYINAQENIAYDGEFLYYENIDAEKPEKVMPLRVVKKKDKIYIKIGDSEFLMIGKKAVVIDHEQKAMRIRDNLQVPDVFNFAYLDAMGEYEGFKAEKFASQQGITGIRFSNPNHSKTFVELLYRHDINMITFSKMVFDVDSENANSELNKKKIEASFYNHQLSYVKFPYDFDHYFSGKGKKVIAAKSCKGYQVI